MQSIKLIALLCVFLITIMAGMGIIELWQPELLDQDAFIKVAATFGILALLSFLVGTIAGFAQKKKPEQKPENQTTTTGTKTDAE